MCLLGWCCQVEDNDSGPSVRTPVPAWWVSGFFDFQDTETWAHSALPSPVSKSKGEEGKGKGVHWLKSCRAGPGLSGEEWCLAAPIIRTHSLPPPLSPFHNIPSFNFIHSALQESLTTISTHSLWCLCCHNLYQPWQSLTTPWYFSCYSKCHTSSHILKTGVFYPILQSLPI